MKPINIEDFDTILDLYDALPKYGSAKLRKHVLFDPEDPSKEAIVLKLSDLRDLSGCKGTIVLGYVPYYTKQRTQRMKLDNFFEFTQEKPEKKPKNPNSEHAQRIKKYKHEKEFVKKSLVFYQDLFDIKEYYYILLKHFGYGKDEEDQFYLRLRQTAHQLKKKKLFKLQPFTKKSLTNKAEALRFFKQTENIELLSKNERDKILQLVSDAQAKERKKKQAEIHILEGLPRPIDTFS